MKTIRHGKVASFAGAGPLASGLEFAHPEAWGRAVFHTHKGFLMGNEKRTYKCLCLLSPMVGEEFVQSEIQTDTVNENHQEG